MSFDLSAMMQMAEKLQRELGVSQNEAQATRVTGEAGGGLVRVVLNGRYEAVEVHIDPKAYAGDRQLVEDLVRAAFNQASGRVMDDLQKRVSNVAQGLGVDLGALGAILPKR